MRAPLLAFALAALAGCASPADMLAPPAGGGASDVLPWTLTSCRYLVGWSVADPAEVQAQLPEGFTVEAGTPFGLPVPVEQAIIGTEAFECESGSGLDGTVESMLYASIWIPVVPPPALAVDGIEEVYYKIHVLVPDEPRRAAFEARGVSVSDGALSWEASAVPNGVASALTLAGAGDFRLDLAAPQQGPTGETTEFIEISPAGERGERGFAVWRANYSWDGGTVSRGRGFIDWPEGHWVADAVGGPRAPGQFHAGTWSFAGTVTLPAAR